MSYTEAWLTGHSNTKFYTRTYKAAHTKAVVVFVHGYCEHIGRYEHAHPIWAARGITVFAYDGRGAGKTALDKQNKSPNSSYGKASGQEQLWDIAWALKHVKKEFDGIPVFLMGHSMGGSNVIRFVTRPPDSALVESLSGIISSSPWIYLAHPVPRIGRWLGRMARPLFPNLLIPAAVNNLHLSHDPARVQIWEDPLIKGRASISLITDSLDDGEALLKEDYKHWPKTMPLLVTHGADDEIIAPMGSQMFVDKVEANDKHISFYDGGYHELVNEVDGVWQKFTEECISWVEAHIPEAVTSKL